MASDNRVLVVLTEEAENALKQRAEQEHRSVSNLIASIVMDNLRERGLLSAEEQKKQELLAAAEDLGADRAIEALRREARRKRRRVTV